MARQCCAIIGFGPGLGSAYARVFHDAGYDLALLSRSGSGMENLTSGPAAATYSCDASNPGEVTAVLEAVERDLGSIDVLIYNADTAQFGALDDVSAEQFEKSWQVASLGLFSAAKVLGPRMAERKSGTIIVSGATASLRGNVWTTAFSPAKAAQRILTQSLAKQLGPQGVHVAYLIIDGVIDTEDTRTNYAQDEPDEFFIEPERIAEAALMLAKQHRSAWTFELDLRPFGEKW